MASERTGRFRESLRLLTGRDTIASADVTLRHLRQLGIRVPNPNRISQARDYLLHLGNQAEVAGAAVGDYEMVGEAFRTLVESFFIVRAADPGDPTQRDSLPRLLEGAETPGRDANPKARSTQFELFVYSLLRLGGVSGVSMGEPDIRIQACTEFLGLAVKRLTSPAALEKRVKEAAGQIRDSGASGLIVLGLDPFVTGQTERNATRYVRRITSECAGLVTAREYSGFVLGIFGMGTRFFSAAPDGTLRLGIHFAPSLYLLAPRRSHTRVLGKLATIGRGVLAGVNAQTQWLQAELRSGGGADAPRER